MAFRRRAYLVFLLLLSTSASAWTADPDLSILDWSVVTRIASTYVQNESPSSVLPFHSNLGISGLRKVYIHYFTPLPISPDNRKPLEDYWNMDALRPFGLLGKYASVGGYLRDRPLPIGPWPDSFWHEINYAVDVLRARLIGGDGFIVGIFDLDPRPEWRNAHRLCQVAAVVAPGFEIIPQIDADALVAATPLQIAQALWKLPDCGALARTPDGRFKIMIFDPPKKPLAFWQEVSSVAAAHGMPLAVTPLFLDPVRWGPIYSSLSYGIAYWGAADPLSIQGPGSGEPLISREMSKWPSTWMAPVRPQDFRAKIKAYYEAGNSSTFRMEWEYAIRSKAPIVHIITWNDFTESSEIEPSARGQYFWYDLSRYYISYFKSGITPNIEKDAIYFNYRNQMAGNRDSQPVTGTPFDVLGETSLGNNVEILGFLARPGLLEIQMGNVICSHPFGAGLASLRCPAATGTPIFRIRRQGQVAVEVAGAWAIRQDPDRVDALYGGGSSLRPYIHTGTN